MPPNWRDRRDSSRLLNANQLFSRDEGEEVSATESTLLPRLLYYTMVYVGMAFSGLVCCCCCQHILLVCSVFRFTFSPLSGFFFHSYFHIDIVVVSLSIFFLSLFFFFYFKIGFLHVCRRRHGGKLHDVFLYSVLTSAKVHFFKFTRIQCVVLNKSQQNKKLFPFSKLFEERLKQPFLPPIFTLSKCWCLLSTSFSICYKLK